MNSYSLLLKRKRKRRKKAKKFIQTERRIKSNPRGFMLFLPLTHPETGKL